MITLLLSFALQAHAADPSTDVVKVTSIVQYVDGRAQKTESSGVKVNVVFQTAVYEGDRVYSGGVLKLATRTGCIFVLRGESSAVAAKSWRLHSADSLRVVCANRSAAETFVVENKELTVRNGEVLITAQGVLLLQGGATLGGVALPLRRLVSMEAADVSPQPEEAALRAMNLAARPPSEAYQWPELAKPDKVYTWRSMIGPVAGRSDVGYDSGDLNESKLKSDGGRFQLQFKTEDDHAFIVSFGLGEIGNNKDGSNNDNGVKNSIEPKMLEVGYRSRFDRWWSPYWRVGLGVVESKIYYSQNNGGTSIGNSGYKYPFYAFSASYGIDAQVRPHFLRPVAFFAAAEVQGVQSLLRGGRINEHPGNQVNTSGGYVEPDEPWRLTLVSLFVNAGLIIQF